MSNEKMSQKDYLRKYLSSGDDGKKKKKKKPKVGATTLTIIDDDVDLKNMRPIEDGEFEILNAYTEDAPQIVGIVDERGPADFADKRRWKIIADDGDGNVAVSSREQRQRDADDESIDETKITPQMSKRSKKSKKSKGSDNEDFSPPRRSQNDSDNDLSSPRASKHKKRKRGVSQSSDEEEDDSSPRRKSKSKNKKHGKSRKSSDFNTSGSSSSDHDSGPPRRSKYEKGKKTSGNGERNENRKAFDSDLSPLRESKSRRDFDMSAQGNSKQKYNEKSRFRTDSDGDSSPPRRSKNNQRSVETLQKSKNRGGSDSDLSPPRITAKKHQFENDRRESRPSRKESERNDRQRKRGGSDSDLSPPRLSSKKQHSGDGRRDYHPGHRQNDRNDRQRNRGREDSDARSGPPDKYRRRSKSPRRKSRWNDERTKKSVSPEPFAREGHSRMKKTLDGKTAGLQDARALRVETEAHKKREADLFKKMSAEVSGIGQAAVLRDRKTGRRRDLAAEAAERREKEKRQEEIDEKYAKWGKGLKQVEDQEDKLERDLREMSKPLARYADDADLNERRKAELHAEDPMMEQIMERQIKDGTRKLERPSYQGSCMPNRFGIKPGQRWDGVDRSNGYEKRWFESRNARAAIQEEAYKWSTADM